MGLLTTGLLSIGAWHRVPRHSWVRWRIARQLERQELPRRFTNFLGFDSILGMVSGAAFVMVGLSFLVVAGVKALAQ
jgi:hypothetical protein